MTTYTPERAEETPTQVQHPWRAALRTALAYLLALAVVLPIAWGIITDELHQVGWTVPEPLGQIVVAIIAAITVLAAIVTRIMAIPQVSDLLTRLGLGPEPPERAEQD